MIGKFEREALAGTVVPTVRLGEVRLREKTVWVRCNPDMGIGASGVDE